MVSMKRLIRRRHTAREIREIVPADVSDRLASAGFIIVEGYLAHLLQLQLEGMMQTLIEHPTSKSARAFTAKTQHALILVDALLEE